MKTELPLSVKQTHAGQMAEKILRSCVHCGFCLATCPTYHLLGEEMNAPRGRIYLIKTMLEGGEISAMNQQALDQCLVCRSCETTCPSGVQYHHLLDVGREWLDTHYPRSAGQKMFRTGLRKFLTTPWLFNTAITLGKLARPVLPKKMKRQLAQTGRVQVSDVSISASVDKVLLLTTCVQPGLAPAINAKASAVLAHLNVAVAHSKQSQCCGAIDQHLGASEAALQRIKANIDDWYLALTEQGCSTLVSTASGCGAMVKDYAALLKEDADYAEKAAYISAHHQDIAEYLQPYDLSMFAPEMPKAIAVQLPCSLQHGQKITGVIESILTRLGYQVPAVRDAHFCCGSAGTYSIFHPNISTALATQKLENLSASNPQYIASANIGCISHLQAHTDLPVRHWIELLALDD